MQARFPIHQGRSFMCVPGAESRPPVNKYRYTARRNTCVVPENGMLSGNAHHGSGCFSSQYIAASVEMETLQKLFTLLFKIMRPVRAKDPKMYRCAHLRSMCAFAMYRCCVTGNEAMR